MDFSRRALIHRVLATALLSGAAISLMAVLLLPTRGSAKGFRPKQRVQILMRHDEGENHSFAAFLAGVERDGAWQPTTLHLRQYPCSGLYSLRLKVFAGRHLQRVIRYDTVLNSAVVEGSTFYCSARNQTGDDASGTELETEEEARRRLWLAVDRVEPARNIATFEGNREPSTGDFIGKMSFGMAPCPGDFEFKLGSVWSDGSHPKSLVYSIELLDPRINGTPVKCDHGQVYMTPL